MQKAQEIRRLYKSGKKRKDLAKKFACTTVTIGRVVKNIIYKRAGIQISGQAVANQRNKPNQMNALMDAENKIHLERSHIPRKPNSGLNTKV
jgi:hypothetical protein